MRPQMAGLSCPCEKREQGVVVRHHHSLFFVCRCGLAVYACDHPSFSSPQIIVDGQSPSPIKDVAQWVKGTLQSLANLYDDQGGDR